jgi:RNA polymerase sigma-70 factor, ECF subfamily
MSRSSPAERSRVPLSQSLQAAAAGDETAFLVMVNACDGRLRRLASALLGHTEVDQLVADTWRTALRRSSTANALDDEGVRFWLCRIVVELCEVVGVVADDGTVAFDGPAAERFLPVGHRWEGHWAVPPAPWRDDTGSPTALAAVRKALAALPSARARAVSVLRDVDGVALAEITAILGIDECEARRLLHCGRTALREALERVLTPA